MGTFMKKNKSIIFSLLFFVASNSGFAGSYSKEIFSIETGILSNYRNGYITEYVYKDNTQGESKKLSQLDWNIEDIFQLGGIIRLKIPFLEASFSATATFPKDSGKMFDSDWIGLSDIQTHYSINKNKVAGGYSLSANLQGRIPVIKNLILLPSFALDYENISFETKNIEGWYGSGDTNPPTSYKDPSAKHYPNENSKLCSVDYESKKLYTWLGLNARYNFPCKITVESGAYFSPLVYHFSIDTHWSNISKTSAKYFLDEIYSNFNAIKTNIGVSYEPINNLLISANISWTRLYKSLGDTYTSSKKSSDYTKTSNANSGADSNYISATLSLTYRFMNLTRTDKIRR